MDITDQPQQPANSSVELPCPPVAENTRTELEQWGAMMASDYEKFKQQFMEWLQTEGKNTYKHKGYAATTVKHTHYKVDEAYRWKWDQNDEYTTEFTPDDATELIEFMIRYTNHPGRYVYTMEKCIRRLFKFFRNERGESIEEWEHNLPIEKTDGSNDHIKDKFYPREMSAIYEAALDHYSFPHIYSESLSEQERERLKNLISARRGIPKDKITPEVFNNSSSWKIPSMIAVTCDTGLRPIEIGRATVDWFDTDRGMMVIPADEATKNKEHWHCELSAKSVNAISNWINERKKYEKYRDEEGCWLTKYGNKYQARSLNRILDKLMELAEVSDRNRNLSFYSFRHGSASFWVDKEGLSKAKTQMRHSSLRTTEKYQRDGEKDTGGNDAHW
ncbi:tyrosine-type recombinase/integrase [Halonotius sp. GCM10025705]|uniref:tyrosine-type recombinase/integrase n=1 Tax=Halonotius sp. GCM10025705 TaxID=3252678 RepID=UPI00361CEFC7